MKTKIWLRIVANFLVACILVSMTACTAEKPGDLIIDIETLPAGTSDSFTDGDTAAADFAIRLFQASNEAGRNTLIAPLSVLYALAMTANGAEGETLAQMETVLGMPVEELNAFLHGYMKSLPQGKKYKLNVANSIWFAEQSGFAVNEDFLQTNADHYGADIYSAPFDDSTLNQINGWVKEKTDGMIPKILDQLGSDTVMCLINALAFDARWETVYDETQVHEDIFTLENGTESTVGFMYSEENAYLEDQLATGFIKKYEDNSYAFVALLPKDGVTVEEYIEALTGEQLRAMLSDVQDVTVYTSLPKFETEYSVEMAEILANMGMPLAFDRYNADFSGLGVSETGNLAISQVVHKTFVSVGEQGTKAGAATAVIFYKNALIEEEVKYVYLDRPFVYMIIDCENQVPIFIGTMMDVSG